MSAPVAEAVSSKLPPYYLFDPLLWYTHCEAIFSRQGSNAKQRLDAIVHALPHHIAIAAGERIAAGTDKTQGQYEQLKTALLPPTVGMTPLQRATALLATRQRLRRTGDKRSATPTAPPIEDPGLATTIPTSENSPTHPAFREEKGGNGKGDGHGMRSKGGMGGIVQKTRGNSGEKCKNQYVWSLEEKRKFRRQQFNAIGGLTFITDEISALSFLADTGASVCVLPFSSPKPSASLKGADG